MKTHISIRLNKITEKQIAELRARYSLQQTEVIAMAVNEFYKSKMEDKMNEVKIAKGADCVLVYGTEIIGDIITNRSISVDEAIELLNINADSYDDYSLFELVYLMGGSEAQRHERLEENLQPLSWEEIVDYYGRMSFAEILANLDNTDPYGDNLRLACEIYRDVK